MDYYRDESVTLLLGDAKEVAESLEPQSIQSVVTSPPYFGLRDYGVDGQLGAEASPTEFVNSLVDVFEAIRPALADDGVLWVNIGDSYSSSGGNTGVGPNATVGSTLRQATGRTRPKADVPAKNMLGIPWRFAFAMQDAGWILRNDIIWFKRNAMPSSVSDRFSPKYEHIFMFTKSPRYFFDLDAVRVPIIHAKAAERSLTFGGNKAEGYGNVTYSGNQWSPRTDGKNPGDVWDITTKPFKGAHFATFPPELPERCILASTREGDTVLDPFSGAGTTGMVARKHGRKYVGVDLNAEYHDLALETRLSKEVTG